MRISPIRRWVWTLALAALLGLGWMGAQANELIYLPIVAVNSQQGTIPPVPTVTPTPSPTATPTPTPSPTPAWPNLSLNLVVGGLERPVFLTHAGDGSGRLFVAEQPGRVRVVKEGQLLETPFLDITDRVACCGERGLLGVAFPPGAGEKAYVYASYTTTATVGSQLTSRVSRFPISDDPDRADADAEQIILSFAQPYTNHNGGQITFGPDGFLYMGSGDGGNGSDPLNMGQNLDTLLGKMLRIDVTSGSPLTYTIPASNPFAGQADARPEIWAYGLRNPWRFSFDRVTGDLWIGDVGQNAWEEINRQPADSPGGENYGWRIMEAGHCHNPNPCDPAGLTLPVAEYNHDDGDRSVTGGYVIRNEDFPASQGVYLFGDFVSGRIWGLRWEGDGWQRQELFATGWNLSSFGEDEAGRIYAIHYGWGVYEVVAGE